MLILRTTNLLKHKIELGSDACQIFEHMLNHWICPSTPTTSDLISTTSNTDTNPVLNLSKLDAASSIEDKASILWPDITFQNPRADCTTQNITIKLFFPRDCDSTKSREIVESAFEIIINKLLAHSLSGRKKNKVVGLLLLSLDGMSFREGLDQKHLDLIIGKWLVASKTAQEVCRNSNIELKSIGVCEFSHTNLVALMDAIKTHNDKQENEEDHILLPTVDSINMPDCLRLPPDLLRVCEERGIKLSPHSDPVDIVDPSKLQQLGNRLDASCPKISWNWVAKITSINRDRQILERSEFLVGLKEAAA